MLNGPLSFSRRAFLSRSAATGVFLFSGLPQGRAAEQTDPYGGFNMGIQSYSLRAYDAESALQHTQTLGLKYWEAYPKHIPMSSIPDQVRKQQALLEKYGVSLIAYGVVGFGSNETEARKAFDFAQAMGIKSLSANPKTDRATFDLLDKLCEEYGIPIAIHNHGPGALYDKIDDVIKWTKDRHPLVGACVDTGHFLRSDEDPVEAIERLGKRVFGVHLKDVRTIRNQDELEQLAKELPKNRLARLKKERKVMTILGEGELNVLGCLKALRKLGFQNCLSLEYEENAQNPLSDIEVCLQTVRAAVKKLSS